MDKLDDPRHQEFLEWLCTLKKDRQPSTMAALADKLGVHVRTLRDWKERPDFIKAHEALVRRLTGAPERTQEVLAALHETALDREHRQHVAAAKTWLDQTGWLGAQVTKESGDATKLTDEQLRSLIEAKATEIATTRGIRLVKEA